MTSWQLTFRSLWHHRRVQLAVLLGVAVGTAVLTGALLVGDSVRGSLRNLTLERLGKIDFALAGQRFFRAALADETAAAANNDGGLAGSGHTEIAPAILLEATLSSVDGARRASRVTVVGSDERFWRLADAKSAGSGPLLAPAEGRLMLNRPLASELGVEVGDEVILRVGQPSEIPADSPLGRKTETVRSRRLIVAAVVPAQGLGRFALTPSQREPLNAYAALETLQTMLEQPGKVNALLATAPRDVSNLDAALPLLPEDLGMRIEPAPLGYLDVSQQRMLLDGAVVEIVRQTAAGQDIVVQPALTYLANTISVGTQEIPYSTVTAIDFAAEPPLGPWADSEGQAIAPLGPGEIVLNAWAAEQLAARVGDAVRVTYFEPESTHGAVREATADFRLAAIAALTGAADDPRLTPELKGVTDQTSMADWDPPFPFQASRIRKVDEQYWDEHRASPKAFISLAAGQKLWGSRFGNTTSLRLACRPADQRQTCDRLAGALRQGAGKLGFRFLPVRQMQLAAARGTTPFDLLFLGFSMFLIAAALMLVSLLFRLGVDGRAQQVGLLSAAGLAPSQIRKLLLREGALVAGLGSALGVAGGVGYARLMMLALGTWWSAAVQTSRLELFVTPQSLAIGGLAGMLASLAAMAWSLRRLDRLPVRQLLQGQTEPPTGAANSADILRPAARWPAAACAGLAAAMAAVATQQRELAQAGAFFGSGALTLAACLLWVRQALERRSGVSHTAHGLGLTGLAARNAARHRGRSVLTMGLVAAASFLIAALSAFRQDPAAATPRKDNGTGGLALLAETDLPLYHDLNSPDGQAELGLAARDKQALAGVTIYPVRVRPGDDASCLNLYQPQNPRVIGLPQSLLERGGFGWSATAAKTPDQRANPWLLLTADDSIQQAVPMVIDANTAQYSLHLRGVGAVYATQDPQLAGRQFQVAGLLANSILQGDLIVSEATFRQLYPDVSGYRMLLVDAPDERVAEVQATLERALSDLGCDAQTTGQRLAGFLAVQNTYLSTFQSLGGLGLLLGTLGLAAVQLRNVLERRAELALLRAAGFTPLRLVRLVLTEHALLLCGGLGIGVVAAAVAVAPHLVSGALGAASAAGLPWRELGATLAAVLAVGLFTGGIAAVSALRAPLLPSLRGQ